MGKIKLFTLLLTVVLLAGCKDDEPTIAPVITITNSVSFVNINYTKGSETTVTFTVNTDWTTDISYEGDASEWLSVTPRTGSAGKNIVITLKVTAENPSNTNWTAYLNIRYGGGTYRLKITPTAPIDTDITAHFDTKFAAQLEKRGYIPNAKKIMLTDVKDIKRLDVSGTLEHPGNLTSLAGIEFFESLTELYCSSNQLTTLDVSKSTLLTQLICQNNKLAILNVSKNTALTILECGGNQLTSLDVSKNIELTLLYCYTNKLTALDVSKNRALTGLYCFGNQLTTLGVSKNTALTSLLCYENQITTLNVSKNTVLTELWCGYNQLKTLDVRKNTALTDLRCYCNQLTTLDTSNNTELTILWCSDNLLSSLDVSNNKLLNDIGCHNNPGNGGVFFIMAWFDDNNVPEDRDLPLRSWGYNGKQITVEYIKK